MGTTSRDPRLPDVIKIDDIASGRIEPQLIYEELDRLKVEINILRNDMSLFIKALATIPENQSQQEYYKTAKARLKTVQASIEDYCTQYYKLLPIINLAQIKLGHEVEIVPQKTPVLPDAVPPKPLAKPMLAKKPNGVRNGSTTSTTSTNGTKKPATAPSINI